MMRLVFSDLRDHAATWIGAFLVAVGCGYIGGWAVSILTTTETYRNLETLVWTMVAFSSFAAAVVLVSAANLTVSAQRRSYALWQIANVSPRSVSAVVLAQLAVVATLGAACGTLVESVTYAPLFPWVFSSPFYQPIDQVVLEVGASRMPTVWLAVAAVSLVGGLKGARSAGETPPLEALRDSEPKRRGMTWLRAILFASLATGTCALSVFMVEAQSYAALSNALFVPLLAVATLATVAPVVLSALMRAWTSIMPQLRWNAWYLARHTARYGLSLSTSVETPVMVGFDLLAGVASLSNVALLIAGGARPRTLLAAAVCEAFIHAVTATLAGMAAVAVSNVVTAYAVGMPLFDGLAFGEGLAVSLAGFVLVLAATLVPTLAALRKEPATVLAMGE